MHEISAARPVLDASDPHHPRHEAAREDFRRESAAEEKWGDKWVLLSLSKKNLKVVLTLVGDSEQFDLRMQDTIHNLREAQK